MRHIKTHDKPNPQSGTHCDLKPGSEINRTESASSIGAGPRPDRPAAHYVAGLACTLNGLTRISTGPFLTAPFAADTFGACYVSPVVAAVAVPAHPLSGETEHALDQRVTPKPTRLVMRTA